MNAARGCRDAIVVVKVGGSLLDWPLLPERISEWAGLQIAEGGRIVYLVGGGKVVDAVRGVSTAHDASLADSHDWALRAMDLTAYLFQGLMKQSALRVVATTEGLHSALSKRRQAILAPSRWLALDESHSGEPLEHSWELTSDSIAARLARRLHAGRLVLAKSAPLPVGCGVAQAAETGLIDGCFLRESRGLRRIDYLYLRGEAGVELSTLSARESPIEASVASESDAMRWSR
jgi:aspartokinase-like uncharacterized kinase